MQLDAMSWEDVDALAELEENIRRHVERCAVYKKRENAVLAGRLASYGAEKRQRILSAADRLVAYFINKPQ